MKTVEKDGIPSFYISEDHPFFCTHRTSDSDLPVWCSAEATQYLAKLKADFETLLKKEKNSSRRYTNRSL